MHRARQITLPEIRQIYRVISSPGAPKKLPLAHLAAELLVDLRGQRLDPPGQFLGEPREVGILLEQRQELGGLLECLRLLRGARSGQRFPVEGVGLRVGLVPIGLAGLCQEDEWRGVGRLEAERQVQEYEG
jgi:hypothetical protein